METAAVAAEIERTSRLLDRAALDRLIQELRRAGHRVIGPQVRDGAIVLDTIEHAADLPEGWLDEPGAGTLRLRRDGRRLFGYSVAMTSAKRFVHPPRVTLWRARGDARGFETVTAADPGPPLALLGLKPCDVAALAVLDRALLGGPWSDAVYRERRAGAWRIVVQCGRAGANCFCTSMGGGPCARTGFDVALTELEAGDTTVFVAEPGSTRGAELLAAVGAAPASDDELERAAASTAAATAAVTRRLDTRGLAAALAARPEHPRWADVAARCLACGSCTQVCPTCFCVSVDDHPGLDGTATRERRWDTCFAPDYSYIHGGNVRASVRARYRHWLTHKLSSWHEQFGSSGCVGCGRCITWCPAGIDITFEAAAVAAGAEEDPR